MAWLTEVAEEKQRFDLAANINEVTATMDVLRSDHQELAAEMNITPIKYTDVKVHKGGCYSTITGKFTASVAALYYFEQYWVMYCGYWLHCPPVRHYCS